MAYIRWKQNDDGDGIPTEMVMTIDEDDFFSGEIRFKRGTEERRAPIQFVSQEALDHAMNAIEEEGGIFGWESWEHPGVKMCWESSNLGFEDASNPEGCEQSAEE